MNTPTAGTILAPGISPIEVAWINFIVSLKKLLAPVPNERAMDQYLEFRDQVLGTVLSKHFIDQLEAEWNNPGRREHQGYYNLLLLELQAFPRAVEVAEMVAIEAEKKNKDRKEGTKKKSWWQRGWLGRASTVTGSVKDVLNTASAPLKIGLTALGELLDLFRGK